MSRKHPKVLEFGKKIDMSDLEADKYIMFQKEWVSMDKFMPYDEMMSYWGIFFLF